MDSLVWHLTNLVSNFILPPTVFFILIAFGIWRGQRKAWGRWLAYGSVAVLALLCIPAVSYLLVKPFETAWPPLDLAQGRPPAATNAVVVILGGGRTLGAMEYPEGETLSDVTLKRCRYGAILAQRLALPVSVSGGKPDGGQHSEAELMRDFLQKELKHAVVHVEDRSFDTRQSALYTAAQLRNLKLDTVFLVTDVWHMPRAMREFEAAGIKVIPAPMGYRAGAPLDVMEFLPSPEGLRLSSRVLHELVGEVWYSFRRWIE